MKQDPSGELDAYYEQAASWSVDLKREVRRSRQIAWWVAGAATLIAFAEAIALIALTPLKTVVPYTLLVDRQTGHVQSLDPVNGERIQPDEALTRSFLVQYVTAREAFAMDVLQQNYRKTLLFSDAAARSSYSQLMQASNRSSPLSLYPRRAVVDVEVKSVSRVNADTAMVRFDTIRQDPGAQPRRSGSWVSVIRYRYSDEPLSAADRLVNPLGFLVTRYNRDPELLPEQGPAVTPVPDPVVVVQQPSADPRGAALAGPGSPEGSAR